MDTKFDYKIIDLTHTISPGIPTWDGSCGFEMIINTDYKDCTPPDLFRTQQLNMKGGIGTHMDSPAHCIPGGKTIDLFEMEDLVTDCVIIDVISESDENYVITPEVVEKFEKEHGEIKPNTFVIFNTGWSEHWENKDKYINDHKFPSVHVDTAKLLLERGVAGLGIDTLSADTGAGGFPVPSIIRCTGKYLVENIVNAEKLPAIGSKILVLPMKIKDATEAPLRLIALI